MHKPTHLAMAVTLAAALTACAHHPAPALTQSTTPTDAELAAALQGSETAPAVGLLAVPITTRVMRWLGRVVLQAVTNTTVNVQMSIPQPPDSR